MIPGALNFDELNKLVVHKRAVPYEEYFGDMDLTEEEYEERIRLAEDFESSFLPVMALMFLMQLYDQMNWAQIQQRLVDAYQEAVRGYAAVDDRLQDYIQTFAQDVVFSTQSHMDDPYYFSMDRAQFLAENETNTTLNGDEFYRAVAAGYQKKTWRGVKDKRERQTHLEVEGETIPILQPFAVGEFLMMYPKDESLGAGPEEVVNCRCHLEFADRQLGLESRASANATRERLTGGHHYLIDEDADMRSQQAAVAYEYYARHNDVSRIAANTGFSEDEIALIRHHIFFAKHNLYDGYGRFAPDYDMAVAWGRLRAGSFLSRDLTLLSHELLESRLEKDYNLDAYEAHRRASEHFDWAGQLENETDGGEEDGVLQSFVKKR